MQVAYNWFSTKIMNRNSKHIHSFGQGIQITKKKNQNFTLNDFPITRTRKTKTFFDEKAKDEPIIDGKEKFKIDTFYVLMDTAVVSMEKRFEKI